ncbi:hypothetical protein BWD42_11205 [Sphingobacterium sp. CZ-UAM]|jgi:MFS family permease|uniref:hypothetical protein n=1 Tax=Sphingobacterium sp. CZ-UAM TaxID=1933868 RepID=UPI0009864862|nr:hypothetical protein [Sphingobacterium sp. CZ-UAM]OOG17865.1 hypothetical protein BWD42_11205 [Sphingobacterium sp. CZ-UAM]
MTTANNVQTIAEKVKSFAMGFIGAFFLALGVSYFSEQSSYRVPRILLPVYEFLGNIGLAIGLLILGGILLYYAYIKFKKYGGRPVIMLIVLPLFTLLAFGINTLFNNNQSGKSAQNRQATEQVGNANRPELNNEKAEKYLDKLENLFAEMTKAKERADENRFKLLETQFLDLGTELAIIIPELAKTDQYPSFIEYNAYVSNKIQKMRMN